MISISSAYTQRSNNWTDWKAIQVTKSLVYQFHADSDIYWIWGYDGPECFITQIWIGDVPFGVIQSGYTQEQNDADKLDFEDNFRNGANKTLLPGITTVTTQFEKRDKTIKLAHAEGTVGEDGIVTILLKVPGTPGSADGRWISSGTAFFDVHTPGDKVLGVYFTDEDNILGGGVGTVIGSYTDDDTEEVNRGWAVPPNGFLKAEAIGGYGFAPAGFFMKIIAKKTGDSPSGKFYCNIEWGKVE